MIRGAIMRLTYSTLLLAATTGILAGSAGPSEKDEGSRFPYRWSSLVSIPISLRGFDPDYTEFYTGSVSRQLREPFLLKKAGVRQAVGLGMQAYTHYRPTSSLLGNNYASYASILLYGLTEFQRTVGLNNDPLLPMRLSLIAGGGLGYTSNWWEDEATGETGGRKGIGFIVSAGLRADIWRLAVQTRLNLHSGAPNLIPTASMGYQTKGLAGAMVLPAVSLALFVIMVVAFAGVNWGGFL
ncbi:MAG: hypothetical protein V3U35_04955 [Candidatus Neomarinimicrobiota bacterium]